MKLIPYLIIPVLTCCLPEAAANVVSDSPQPESNSQQPALPESEQRIRSGIVILGTLCQSMAAVQDYNTAEAAVPQIMRLRDELLQWTRSFNNLPPLAEHEEQVYEDRYLPMIRKINRILETQADRLAAAEYYGSRNLAAALVHMAQVGH